MKSSPRSFRFPSLLIVLAAVPALQAQSPQNPLPISGPITITASGYYRLTHSIVSAATIGNIITVQAHNVTIDFNTFFINGPQNKASALVGVSANEFGNLTIKNGSIAFCAVGIQLDGNNNPATTRNINHIIADMRITNCYVYGVYFPHSSPGSIVSNCQFSQIGGNTASHLVWGVSVPNTDPTVLVKDNVFSNLTGPSSAPNGDTAVADAFAVRNTISNCASGVGGGKYQNNLTNNVGLPFFGGTDAGGNN